MLNKANETLQFHGQGETGEPAWRRFLVGESPATLQLCEIIKLIASKRVTVLISGETGTGKEVVARALHAASNRASAPMVAVNCTALPASLVESELFGHAKGAFTGAHLSRPGRFEQANRGTIFLDEIGDLPLEAQAKLLRVLQEQEFERVGSSETVRVDVRVIAASNVDLEKAVAERKFREDLYYRLNVVPIHLSSLRERRCDIPLLLQHFLQKIASAECSIPRQLSDEAIAYLTAQEWPGNVRQLEHTVQMACALSGDRLVLRPSDFVARGRAAAQIAATASIPVEIPRPMVTVGQEGIDFDQVVETFERSLVTQALAVSGGNKARAADLLRIKRTTLLAKMKVFDDRDADTPALPVRLKAVTPISKPAALLIEEDGPVRKLLARTLEREGYRVLEAGNSETAVDLFDCWKSQIKLLVASSEASNQEDSISRLRKGNPALPAIVLTDGDGIYSASTNGARTELLLRPFSSEDLHSALGRLRGVMAEESSELHFACA